MIRYSHKMIFIQALLLFVFIFAGRGVSIGLFDFNLSVGSIFGFFAILLLVDKINFNYIFNDGFSFLSLIFVFLFFFFSFFSLLYTKSFFYGLDKTLNLFLYFLIFLAYCSIFNKSEILKILTYMMYIILPMAIIYIFINIISGFDSRIGLFGAGSITTGRIFSFACIVSIYLFLQERKNIYSIFFLFFIIAVFLSGSRGNFIFLIVALVFPWMFNNFKLFFKIFTFFFFFFSFFFYFKLYENIPFFYRYSLLLEGGGESILIRFEAYRLALTLFYEHFFFGVGTGGYSFYTLGRDSIDYPHNIFLEIAAELGFIGLVLFFGLCVATFFSSIKNTLVLSLLVFYMLASSGSGDLFDARLIFVLPLLCCILKRD